MRILINNLYRPELDQSSFLLDQQASDPVPTCNFILRDETSSLPLSSFQEVIVIDETAYANPPTHNFLQNPVMNPYNSGWQAVGASGVALSQNGGGGLIVTLSNAAASDYTVLAQTVPDYSLSVPRVYVQPNQAYTFSVTVQGNPTNAKARLSIQFFDGTGAPLTGNVSGLFTVTGTPQIISMTLTSSAGAASASVSLIVHTTSGTNSGSITFTQAQFEANWFPDVTYPTVYVDEDQTNGYQLPDGTSVREKRLFGGWITHHKFTPVGGGPVAEWTINCSAYGWLFDKRTNNSTFTAVQDDAMITGVVSQYFSGIFTSNHVVAAPLTISNLQYSYDTLRKLMDDICTLTLQRWFVDPYGDVWYVPLGYIQAGYGLSDAPDEVTTFPYSSYGHEYDFTQPTNSTTIKINVPSPGTIGIARIEQGQARAKYGFVFEKYIDDSQIIDQGMAHTRGVSENIQNAYARETIHLELDEQAAQRQIAPGVSIQITSTNEGMIATSFIIQKVSISILASGDNTLRTRYKYAVDLGAYNPNLENLIIRNFVQVGSTSTILPNPTAQWNMANEAVGINETITHTP